MAAPGCNCSELQASIANLSAALNSRPNIASCFADADETVEIKCSWVDKALASGLTSKHV